ncbi:helix-turn-helix domain-containing protein [Undibacterium flavidum]|uniref:Helix-turn-helix domain-containing protein n=1 Tax=Undibacterium flavidum TaxID=2762297 RepID=A0ABR6YFJ4_9BURK|nr:helix-turn-helix domain-containing protein [Undibacterium flavidum]MBC3875341.1 helix-turn-helix domain-containing protein [Undibacterium flavidum]
MNFGEKLKQIRTEKNLTQPQMAEAIGIEQSYLSKLENDKSVPSADMFQSILKALNQDANDFLKDIDKKILQGPLKQIPEVSNFLNTSIAVKVHSVKKWLLSSAAACTLGFACMLAANDGIFFSNNLYKYESMGVFLADEPENIFDQYAKILTLKVSAKLIAGEEFSKLLAEFETKRKRPVVVEQNRDQGTVYYQNVDGGRRKFELTNVRHVLAMPNKYLQFLGGVLVFCGILGFFMEWRLRKLQPT